MRSKVCSCVNFLLKTKKKKSLADSIRSDPFKASILVPRFFYTEIDFEVDSESVS